MHPASGPPVVHPCLIYNKKPNLPEFRFSKALKQILILHCKCSKCVAEKATSKAVKLLIYDIAMVARAKTVCFTKGGNSYCVLKSRIIIILFFEALVCAVILL